MNPPEHELARKVVEYLNDGLDRIEPSVRERLATARMHALSHHRAQPGTERGPVLAAWLADHRLLLAAAALVAATAGTVYWQSTRPANGLADLDTNLLTDELPVSAYLDKGFDSWLKRSSR